MNYHKAMNLQPAARRTARGLPDTGRAVVSAARHSSFARKIQAKQQSTIITAAAADFTAVAADHIVSNAVPYSSKSLPKLRSRSMVGGPADGIWSAINSAILQMELFAAATVDRDGRIGPVIMSVLAAAAVGMGIDAVALLQHGLPPYFQDLLYTTFGAWDTTLWTVALTVVAVPVTAWALRAWWVSSVLLLSAPGGAVQQLQQLVTRQQQPEQQQDVPEPQQQQVQAAEAGSWLAGLLAAIQAVCLGCAVSSISSIVYSSSLQGQVISGATAVLAAAVAAAPVALALRHRRHATAAGSLLAADAAYVVAMLGLAPAVNAVAAAVTAVAVVTLHRQLVAPRLEAFKAGAGDKVAVHVSLKVAGTEAVFDSTLSEDPIQIVAAPIDPEFLQAWKDLSPNELWDQNLNPNQADQQQDEEAVQDEAADADSSSTGGSDSSSTGPSRNLRDMTHSIQSWMANPAARWDAVEPFAAEAACGMVLGETRSVTFFNPRGVGYWNPKFSWWQPKADVLEKFRGGLPDAGDVFWYPVSDTAYVRTKVTSIGVTHVELDANYGVTGTELQMDVRLVRLEKH